jgi:hypothetical protein
MYPLAGLVMVAGVLAVGLGISQESDEASPDRKAPKISCCPDCGMPMGDTKSGMGRAGRMKDMQARMKEAGVSEDTIRTHMAMMNAPLFLDSPGMLLGQAEALTLTEEQKTRLAEVAQESRTKAVAVLTEAQRTKLGPVSDKPVTMMEMRAMMMQKMAPMMEKARKDGGVDSAMTQ